METSDRYFVYRHTSPNGKVYIGVTCKKKPSRRWNGNGSGYNKNRHFAAAIKKYGWDNFSHEILFSGLTKEEAFDKEVELIRAHKSNNPDYGYNQSSGGEHPGTGCRPSLETRKKLSEARKGKKFTEEHKKNLGLSRRTRVIVQMTLDGELLEKYPTTKIAAAAVGCSQSLIVQACLGGRKTGKGYIWKYENI